MVGHDQVDIVIGTMVGTIGPGKPHEKLTAIGGLEHFMTFFPECVGDKSPHLRIILGKKDPQMRSSDAPVQRVVTNRPHVVVLHSAPPYVKHRPCRL